MDALSNFVKDSKDELSEGSLFAWMVLLAVLLAAMSCASCAVCMFVRLMKEDWTAFQIKKMLFQVGVIVLACGNILDVFLDWNACVTFFASARYGFASLCLVLLLVAPMACAWFEHSRGIAKVHPLAYLVCFHTLHAAYRSLLVGFKEYGLVFGVVCEVSLETYYQSLLQAYSLLLHPIGFHGSYTSVTLHLSVLLGFLFSGKNVALELDFYGQVTLAQQIGDQVQCYVWEGKRKTHYRVKAEVILVKSYSCVVAEMVGVLDRNTIKMVELEGGSGKPWLIKRVKVLDEDSCPKDSPLRNLYPGLTLFVARSIGQGGNINGSWRGEVLCGVDPQELLRLSNERMEFQFCKIHEVPPAWTTQEEVLEYKNAVVWHRQLSRCVFRISEIAHTILLLGFFGALWCKEDANSANYVMLVLAVDFLVLYMVCRYVVRNKILNEVFAFAFLIAGPILMFRNFSRWQWLYYVLRVVQSGVLAGLLVARFGTADVWCKLTSSIFGCTLVGSTLIFLLILPFELITMDVSSKTGHGDYARVPSPGDLDSAPLLRQAIEDDDHNLAELLAHTYDITDGTNFLRLALMKRHTRTVQALTALYNTQDAVLPANLGVMSIAAFPDGLRAATADRSGMCLIWVLGGESEPLRCEGHTKAALDVDVFPDSSRIATVGDDNEGRICDAATGKCLTVLRGHQGAPRGIRVFPDSCRVATFCVDKTARVWNVHGGEELICFNTTSKCQLGAVFPHGKWLLGTSFFEDKAYVWDIDTGATRLEVEGKREFAHGAAVFPDGTRFAITGGTTCIIWDSYSGQKQLELSGHGKRVWYAAAFPDNRRIITASEDTTARVWCANSGRMLVCLSHQASVWGVAVQPDMSAVLTACADDAGRVWQLNEVDDAYEVDDA